MTTRKPTCVTCGRHQRDARQPAPVRRDCGHYAHDGQCALHHQHDKRRLATWAQNSKGA